MVDAAVDGRVGAADGRVIVEDVDDRLGWDGGVIVDEEDEEEDEDEDPDVTRLGAENCPPVPAPAPVPFVRPLSCFENCAPLARPPGFPLADGVAPPLPAETYGFNGSFGGISVTLCDAN